MRTRIDTQTFRLSTTAPKSRALTADRLFWLMAALLVLILVLVILFPFRVPGDTPLYVDLGGRVLDGQRPYIDYFEINTPTIHFLNALPVAYSRLTGMHPVLAYDLLIWLFVAGAAVGVGIIMTRARQDQLLPNTQPWLIPALMVFASYLEWLLVNYGQRDHIFIL
ncbi:MAG: hypothetical protein KC519_18525, partial [Anaerolineae bacterium]|nr:hypothetical protein [Anaerolineae bacterium]